MARRERITIPEGLSALARSSERDLATASDIRPVVPLHAVPWLLVTYDGLRTMRLDGRAGFVTSLIDGRSTVEMIIDMAGLPEDDTVEILRTLVDLGAIELRDVG